MIKTTILSKVSNNIFLLSSIFCLLFLWINFYIKNINTSLISSIIAIISFAIIYFPTKSAMQKNKYKKNITSQNITDFKDFLMYNSDEKISNIIINCYHISPIEIQNNHIIAEDKDIYFWLDREISGIDIIQTIKNRKTNNILIFSRNTLSSFPEIDGVDIKFESITDFYNNYIIVYHKLESKITFKKKPKIKPKDILCVVLCRDRSKNYFWFGLLLLFSSLFSPFTTYYIISSSILILLAIFSRFNPFFNEKA